jgi:(1->4)-alpha-D-glucan 1-alpha-D-glucosylmutase
MQARHVVAFARRHGGETVITVVPRLVAELGVRPGRTPCDAQLWGETRLEVPFFPDGTVLRDVLAGREHVVRGGGLALSGVLASFPVCVLLHDRESVANK